MNKRLILYFGLVLSFLMVNLLYFFYLRSQIEEIYIGRSNTWFSQLIETVYPRFEVEKKRFDLDFFKYKADQVVIRFNVIVSVIIGLFLLAKRSKKLDQFWQGFIARQHADILIIIFYCGVLFYCHQWWMDIDVFINRSVFYKPILLFSILHISFPPEWILQVAYVMIIFASLMIIFNIKPFPFSVLGTIAFIFFQGFYYSFEKIDHLYTTLTYVMLVMPFLVLERNRGKEYIGKWPVTLIQLCIALAYLFSGLEKLFTSGFGWASKETFRHYIYLHQAPIGLTIAESDFLSSLLPKLALLFQLSFFLILFLHRRRWIFLVPGILFHMGTVFLLNIGAIFTPWIFVYIFFVDWGILQTKFKKIYSGSIFSERHQ
ncbi:hypothetical protein QQ008_04575 [Fulvivirgaceae bacterium BMA10]|uniref:HTTM domain-containing protein n=1 Tax=Splendidivirga corallicola TaxID=3051826 RepID=A0ABT8KK53_9BACT|nr:hypothetical protein [Fulvivirgaceae bacterium BMA10]